MPTELPYKTTFKNILIRPAVSEQKDKLLSIASLAEVSRFIPNIDTAKNVDLLPVAFNACVVNRGNKNTDIIDTATALATYKLFINKPVNIEHHKQKVIGAIISAGFSEFGTDKPLTEADVKDKTEPFNITLGAVVWRAVAPELAELIEEASDPTSLAYQSISASWELGFEGYKIALLDGGKKNLAQASRIIDDPEEVKKVQNKLISLGGDGKIDDLFAYRMPYYTVLPLGVALTEKPAAEVKGVASDKTVANEVGQVQTPAVGKPADSVAEEVEKKPEIPQETKAVETNPENTEKNENKISQATETVVNPERTLGTMKIKSLSDISEASLKDVSHQALATAVSEFISSQLSEKSKQWETEKGALDEKLKIAEAAGKKAQELESSVATLQKEVEAFKKEKTERDAVDKFNARMSEVVAAYDLDDEARLAVIEDVKAIASDEDFAKWQKRANVLLKGFAKKKEVPAEKKEEKQEDKKEAKASEADKVDKAFDKNGEAKGGLPNGQSSTPSLMEKAKLAFDKQNILVVR